MPLFVIDLPDSDEAPAQPAPQGSESLGYAAGVCWYKGASIPVEGREPSNDEMSAALLELPAIRQLKAAARRRIEREVGDVHEILADQARQIEALTALVCRLATDQLGGTALDGDTRTRYLARAESIVSALDSGSLVLRGDVEGADDMLDKVMSRAGRINQIIALEYLPKRDALLDR
ncbi:hypothetical protein QWY79_03685 [Halomonas sabkhae]|uniref:hypothetical protein n=1 Tax=Halomonas sabkhae TaxID=626223 RepID=UPI0025B3A1F9|nr:hypothetical protein [Halomonas sabkhae]MDN3524364.1 hypothetical protein [Halomonas sabkhae]